MRANGLHLDWDIKSKKTTLTFCSASMNQCEFLSIFWQMNRYLLQLFALIGFSLRSYKKFCIKSYLKLAKEKRLSLIRNIRKELSNTKVRGEFPNILQGIDNDNSKDKEVILRQYLLLKVAKKTLNNSIIFSLITGLELIYPLPKEWCYSIKKEGIKVNFFLCNILWILFLWKEYLLNLIKITTNLVILPFQKHPLLKGPFAYFIYINANCIPTEYSSNFSRNLISWYISWKGKDKSIKNIFHNCFAYDRRISNFSISRVNKPYFLFTNRILIIELYKWLLINSLSSFTQLIMGKWVKALMLEELFHTYSLVKLPEKAIAKEYLFTYLGSIYRPLWTYVAESRGSKIIKYFYSTSHQPKIKSGYEFNMHNWHINTWPKYLAWDSYHKKNLENVLKRDVDISIEPPINFADNAEILDLPENSIAVFDIENYKLSKHLAFSTIGDYFTQNPELHKLFLFQIQEALYKNNISMVFKKKNKNIGNSTPKYLNLINQLSKKPNVIIINPEISPERIILKSIGVISMPFTSTSHLANAINKPAIYYDPSSWISQDDNAAQGIEIIYSQNDLTKWAFLLKSSLSE